MHDTKEDSTLDSATAKASRLGWKCGDVMQVALVMATLLRPLIHPGGLSHMDHLVWASLLAHCNVLVLLLRDQYSETEIKHVQMEMLRQHELLKKV